MPDPEHGAIGIGIGIVIDEPTALAIRLVGDLVFRSALGSAVAQIR
jgi:hypothetical protein